MFQFESVSLHDILEEIKNYNRAKSGFLKNIPTHCLKEITDIFSPILTQIWSNKIMYKKSFPKNLKLTDLTPVLKMFDSNLAENYRLVSVLPTVPVVFEKLKQRQLNSYINKFLSPFL